MAAASTRLVPILALALGAGGMACNRDVPPPPPATAESPAGAAPTERVVGPLSEVDAQALASMNDRLASYAELHKKIEGELPRLPDAATPEQIDANQRMLEARVREARKSARQGDLFTPQAQAVIKRLLAAVFAGDEGRQLMSSILDENPVGMKLAVNGRYPDSVPVSSVPPEILQTLPRLSEDMEYRFIGRHLILLDAHAHVIADFIEDALPE